MLRKGEVDSALLYARELPGVSVSSTFQPGEKTGQTDLLMVANEAEAAFHHHHRRQQLRHRADRTLPRPARRSPGTVRWASATASMPTSTTRSTRATTSTARWPIASRSLRGARAQWRDRRHPQRTATVQRHLCRAGREGPQLLAIRRRRLEVHQYRHPADAGVAALHPRKVPPDQHRHPAVGRALRRGRAGLGDEPYRPALPRHRPAAGEPAQVAGRPLARAGPGQPQPCQQLFQHAAVVHAAAVPDQVAACVFQARRPVHQRTRWHRWSSS